MFGEDPSGINDRSPPRSAIPGDTEGKDWGKVLGTFLQECTPHHDGLCCHLFYSRGTRNGDEYDCPRGLFPPNTKETITLWKYNMLALHETVPFAGIV